MMEFLGTVLLLAVLGLLLEIKWLGGKLRRRVPTMTTDAGNPSVTDHPTYRPAREFPTTPEAVREVRRTLDVTQVRQPDGQEFKRLLRRAAPLAAIGVCPVCDRGCYVHEGKSQCCFAEVRK